MLFKGIVYSSANDRTKLLDEEEDDDDVLIRRTTRILTLYDIRTDFHSFPYENASQ